MTADWCAVLRYWPWTVPTCSVFSPPSPQKRQQQKKPEWFTYSWLCELQQSTGFLQIYCLRAMHKSLLATLTYFKKINQWMNKRDLLFREKSPLVEWVKWLILCLFFFLNNIFFFFLCSFSVCFMQVWAFSHHWILKREWWGKGKDKIRNSFWIVGFYSSQSSSESEIMLLFLE